MDLQHLLDRAEIIDLITAYTRAVDAGDYERLGQVFTADAEMDYSSVGGPVGPPAEVVPWIAAGLRGFLRVQHVVGQVDVAIDVDRATATAYFTNPMVAPDRNGGERVVQCGGYYHHDLVRTPDGWRSCRIVDELVWASGF